MILKTTPIYIFVLSTVGIFFVGCSYFNRYPSSGLAINSEGKSCEVLKPFIDGLPHFYIVKPGNYCFVKSYSCYKSYVGWEEGGSCETMLDIRADDVDVDLMGYTLSGNNLVIGRAENVSIRNGTLDSGSIVIGKSSGKGETPFRAHWVMDNLLIRSTGSFIRSSGADNVIRNSKIEITLKGSNIDRSSPFLKITPNASLLHDGPGLILENNKFEVKIDGVVESYPAYAIYLFNANGSHINGNEIRFRGETKDTIAIGLHLSSDVTLENNVITSATSPIRLSAGSSVKN